MLDGQRRRNTLGVAFSHFGLLKRPGESQVNLRIGAVLREVIADQCPTTTATAYT